jgi:single-strand DNA-binding protein
MNIVAIVGNAATDPDLRHTSNGRAVSTFRIAVSRQSADQADFFDVVCWERQAEVIKQYVTIGRRLSVEGRLRHTSWEDDKGRHSRVEIVAHRIQLLGPRAAGTTAEAAASEQREPEPQVI